MNEMLRFMLKPDKWKHGQMHKQAYVWKAFTIYQTYAFHGLSLQSEAIA